MPRLKERLLWFLADPSLSDDDFRGIANFLCNGGADEIVETAWKVREAVRKKNWADVRKRLRHDVRAERYDDPLLENASRLLLVEAHLTVRAAIRALADSLGYEEPLPQSLSFQKGIERILGDYEPSAIVSAAQRIRNQVVHQSPDVPGTTWPLKRGDDDDN